LLENGENKNSPRFLKQGLLTIISVLLFVKYI
jgi:hypothetical protein